MWKIYENRVNNNKDKVGFYLKFNICFTFDYLVVHPVFTSPCDHSLTNSYARKKWLFVINTSTMRSLSNWFKWMGLFHLT